MIKYVLMLLIIFTPVLPVRAQQKLLMPEYGLKRDLPRAPTQDILESAEDVIELEETPEIEPIIIEPIEVPEEVIEEKIIVLPEERVLEILPSQKFIEQKDTQKENKLISLGNKDIVRGLFFGLPKEIVKEYESFIPSGEEENGLIYIDDMWGFKSSIGYEFLSDRLWRIKIINEKRYADPTKRIPDIIAIQTALEEKFGQPTSENFIWLDDVEKDFPQYWGWALHRKELKINVIWEFEDAQIKLIAEACVRSKPEVRVEFISKKYRPEKKQFNFLQF